MPTNDPSKLAIAFLCREPADDFDRLARRAVMVLLRTGSPSQQQGDTVRDISLARVLARAALEAISENFKQYLFVPRSRKGGLVFDAGACGLTDISPSMDAQVNPESLKAIAELQIGKAEEITDRVVPASAAPDLKDWLTASMAGVDIAYLKEALQRLWRQFLATPAKA